MLKQKQSKNITLWIETHCFPRKKLTKLSDFFGNFLYRVPKLRCQTEPLKSLTVRRGKSFSLRISGGGAFSKGMLKFEINITGKISLASSYSELLSKICMNSLTILVHIPVFRSRSRKELHHLVGAGAGTRCGAGSDGSGSDNGTKHS
jgi:hypothetical protein